MNQITPEYLLQVVGELTIENRLLRQELVKLQEKEKLVEKEDNKGE